MAGKKRSSYDLALKGLFEMPGPRLLQELTGGVAVAEFLNVELPRVRERRVDLLARLVDDSLLHVEFQSTNRTDMAWRMAEYYLLLARKFRCPVRQVVLYVGAGRLRMKSGLRHGRMAFDYELHDIREWRAAPLLASGSTADQVLSILCAQPDLRQVLGKIARLPAAGREGAIGSLMALAGLRGFETILRQELKKMPVVIDWKKNSLLREIHEDGVELGLERGREQGLGALREAIRASLRTAFGRVPVWASERIDQASSTELVQWSTKIRTAAKLEDVVPRR